MPYTVAEFAQKIREKYNAYQDVDDQLLVDKMIEKYPVYADQISEVKKKKKQNWFQILKRKLWNLLQKFKSQMVLRCQ